MSCLRSLHLNFAGFLAKKRFFQVLFELLLLPGCFPYINNEIMSDDKKSRELEWFDLETRMRELLYIQLEPVIGKAREDREQHNSLKIHCRSLEKRLKDLETVVLGDKNGETAILNIMNHCSEIDGSMKKEVVRLNQDITKITETLKNLEFQLSTSQESVKILIEKENHANADINQLKELIDDHKGFIAFFKQIRV